MKKVVLKLSKLSVSQKVIFANSVVLQMTGNPFVPSPTVPLLNITNAAVALQTAAQVAENGNTEETADMRLKERALDQLLTAQAGYVEYIANQSGSPDTAVEIILSTGMFVKKQGPINVPILAATALPGAAGVVKLRRKAIKGSAYVWQYRKEDETDFTDAGESTIASFTIADLESLKRYFFRVATVKRQLQSEWSDAVTFVVS